MAVKDFLGSSHKKKKKILSRNPNKEIIRLEKERAKERAIVSFMVRRVII